MAIGSDQHVRIDPFEEARELETLARRERRTRDALLRSAGDLWQALVQAGLDSLGPTGTPEIEIDRDHPDLRGVPEADLRRALVTSASAVVVAGPPPPGAPGPAAPPPSDASSARSPG